MSSSMFNGGLLRVRAMLLAMGAASVLGLAACGGGGGGDSIAVATPSVAALAALDSSGSFTITNSATGALFTASAVTVNLSSSPANMVVDGSGNALTSVTTSSGLGSFFLKAGTDPAVTPVTVYASVTSASFVPKTVAFTFSAKSALNQNLELIALPTVAGPITTGDTGVSGEAATGTATAGGATTAQLQVVVNPAPGETGTTVTIPAATTLTTATGAPAAAGALTLTAVAFSPNSSDALGEFPGGFVAGQVAGAGASTTPATAGFVTLRLRDSAGNIITNFSNPITVSLDIPSTSTLAGVPVVVGGTYPIYRYNTTTQQWVFESTGNIAADNGDGTFRVDFTVTSFSTRAAMDSLPACSAQTITVPSTATDLTATIQSTTSPSFGFTFPVVGGRIIVPAAPTGRPATVKVFQNGVQVSSDLFSNLCAGSLTTSTPTTSGSTGTIVVNATESCADNSNTRALASVVVSAVNTSTSYTETGSTNAAGTVSFTFPLGAATVIATSPRSGTQYPRSVTVTSGGTSTVNYDFLMSCANITGTGTGGGSFSQLP